MIFAAILAGGSGSRMGSVLPKQFLPIAGLPVLVRSVRAFVGCADAFAAIYVAAGADHLDRTRALMDEHFGVGRIRVIEGGSDRSGSIFNVIDAIKSDGGSDDDLLITHDAARPFVTADIIRRNIADTLECGCAGTAVAAVDTILCSADGIAVDSIPPRSQMYQMQTPQGFFIGEYLSCFASLSDEDRLSVTDACGVFLRCGKEVRITSGDTRNLKLTLPLDMAIGEYIASHTDEPGNL